MACLAVYMQQILEQYAMPLAGSREPAQAMKTTVSGTLPSEGRCISPRVGPGGRGQPLELQAVDHVLVFAVAVLGEEVAVLDVEAGGQHDGADVGLDDLVLLVEADGLGGADLLAEAALALQVIGAVLAVDDRLVGHRLREGDVDGRARAQAGVELAGDLLGRAFLGAQAAAGAELLVEAARLLADASP